MFEVLQMPVSQGRYYYTILGDTGEVSPHPNSEISLQEMDEMEAISRLVLDEPDTDRPMFITST